MSPERDKALCDAYPLIFRKRNEKRKSTPMSRGFECGDGWYHIIDALCWAIYAPYSMAKERYERRRDELERAQMEGGTDLTSEDVEDARLQMEVERKAVPAATQVKEKFGTLRLHLRGATVEHAHYCQLADVFSSRVCEICGSPGELRRGGWLQTLCDRHHAE